MSRGGLPAICHVPVSAIVRHYNARQPARPFVLEPQALSGCFLPGSLIGLDLVLLGWINQFLPTLVAALHRLGESGLGMHHRTRLALTGVQQQMGAQDDAWMLIHQPDHPGVTAFPLVPLQPPPAPRRVRLDLVTPFRLKAKNKRVSLATFTAADLLTALERRFNHCRGILRELPPLPPVTQRPQEASDLIIKQVLRRQDTRHYSTRENGLKKMDGMQGHLILHGTLLAEIWPWLWLGQWLHLGSSTAAGFGRYVLTPRQ
jgi:hypothetical protein